MYLVLDLLCSHYVFPSFRVVSTQLGADLTKQIVITDPYRIKVYSTTDSILMFEYKCN